MCVLLMAVFVLRQHTSFTAAVGHGQASADQRVCLCAVRMPTKSRHAKCLAADNRLASLQVVDPAHHQQVLLGSQGGRCSAWRCRACTSRVTAQRAAADVITSCMPPRSLSIAHSADIFAGSTGTAMWSPS